MSVEAPELTAGHPSSDHSTAEVMLEINQTLSSRYQAPLSDISKDGDQGQTPVLRRLSLVAKRPRVRPILRVVGSSLRVRQIAKEWSPQWRHLVIMSSRWLPRYKRAQICQVYFNRTAYSDIQLMRTELH
jgi:hypothetical protein